MDNNLLEKISTELANTINNLKIVKVITVVGPLSVTKSTEKGGSFEVGPKDTPDEEGYKAMISTIDIVEGDIVNAMDRAFVTPDANTGLAGIREFHQKQVEIATKTIHDNINGLINLVKSASGLGLK